MAGFFWELNKNFWFLQVQLQLQFFREQNKNLWFIQVDLSSNSRGIAQAVSHRLLTA
jgi:hypothetical protein